MAKQKKKENSQKKGMPEEPSGSGPSTKIKEQGKESKRPEPEVKIEEGTPAVNEEELEVEVSEAAQEAELQTHISTLEEENSFLKDQLLRKTAEFENFRKRLFREKEAGIKYANSALLFDIITVIDDFERAIQSAEESKDFDSFHTGVTMIEKQLVSMLEKNWGLKRFASIGEEFDPEKHQAIGLEERDEYERSVVLEDYQKGYYLHDRVLRPAKVKVSKPVSTEEPVNNDSEKDNKE